MTHEMKLNASAFTQIFSGSKTYEIRLYDQKRRKVEIGDRIIFSELPLLENRLEVKVLNLLTAESFEELFTMFDPVLAGWEPSDSPIKCAHDMSKYYSIEDQKKYGVIAIEIELNKSSV